MIAALGKRSRGSFSVARSTSRSRLGEIARLILRGLGMGSVSTWYMMALYESPSNGRLPVIISKSITPTEYKSMRWSISLEPLACSGAM